MYFIYFSFIFQRKSQKKVSTQFLMWFAHWWWSCWSGEKPQQRNSFFQCDGFHLHQLYLTKVSLFVFFPWEGRYLAAFTFSIKPLCRVLINSFPNSTAKNWTPQALNHQPRKRVEEFQISKSLISIPRFLWEINSSFFYWQISSFSIFGAKWVSIITPFPLSLF